MKKLILYLLLPVASAAGFTELGKDDSIPVSQFQYMGHTVIITYGTHCLPTGGYVKAYDAVVDGRILSLQYQSSFEVEMQKVMNLLQKEGAE